MGGKQYGIDQQRLGEYASEIAAASQSGAQVAIVIGGGNIFRGLQGVSEGTNRVHVQTALLSGVYIDRIAESMSGPRAVELLEQGHVVVIAGGTGNPFFTTDTAAALRAIEISADVILKGTRVDGIYTADPEKDPSATKYHSLSFAAAYEKQLKVMDLTAFSLCWENKMPILVFDMNTPGNLLKVLHGEDIGTVVS